MNIYALSPEKLDTSSKTDSTQGEHTEGQSITVNPEVSSAITLQIQNFIEGYRANDFGSVYSLKLKSLQCFKTNSARPEQNNLEQ